MGQSIPKRVVEWESNGDNAGDFDPSPHCQDLSRPHD